ncbi:MAG: septation protein A [Betaproteobacteria bacterium]|nr:septation protein A [Betaproteobacteria bacterium]
MKLLFEFLPLILFFIAFKWQGIYVATGVAIAAAVLQFAWMKLRGRTISTMQWISLGVIVVFGGATLLLQDDRFIRWKPTVLYWACAGTLLVGRLFFNALWLQKVMPKDELVLPEAVWIRLTWAWIAFFAAMGCLNLYVGFNYSLDTWANFKVWWSMGIILAFSLAQGVYMARHLPGDEHAAPATPPPPAP